MKRILFLPVFLLIAYVSFGQCADYHRSISCGPKASEIQDMTMSNQSKSALLEARKDYSFDMVLFGKMDYRIIFCAKGQFYPIHFVITEKESGNVLFDNKDDDYIESIGVTIDNTITVRVDVTLLAKDAKFKDSRDNRGCVGIAVLFRKVKKVGF